MFISGFIKTNRYPPTLREIAEYKVISPKGAYDYVEALKKKGYIKTADTRISRSIEVIKGPDGDSGADFLEVPVIGAAAGGAEAGDGASGGAAPESGAILVHKSWVKKPHLPHFALIARGDSMTGAGIMDGDTAIIARQDTAQNGDIIALELDDGYALKRYFKESARVRLETENAAYQPVYCRQIRVAGVLAGVYRSY